jgi:hypothetical protein
MYSSKSPMTGLVFPIQTLEAIALHLSNTRFSGCCKIGDLVMDELSETTWVITDRRKDGFTIKSANLTFFTKRKYDEMSVWDSNFITVYSGYTEGASDGRKPNLKFMDELHGYSPGCYTDFDFEILWVKRR